MNVAGLILAGGQSRRMGTDKSFVDLQGKPLIQHVIDRVHAQVDVLAINTNSADPKYAELGYPLVPDVFEGFQGPLAGIHAGLTWLQSQDADWLATFACDTPFLPEDCMERLLKAGLEKKSQSAVAVWKNKVHPTIGLWHRDLLGYVDGCLRDERRKLLAVVKDVAAARADFSDISHDPFLNLNSAEDIANAKRRLSDYS